MNDTIISQFELLLKYIQHQFRIAQAENNIDEMKMHSFRLKSMKRVINILKNIDEEITDISQIKEISGIGKGTLERISEILEKGYLTELQGYEYKVHDKKELAIAELEEVIGIGPEFAKELVNHHKIFSVKELKKAHKNGKIKLDDQVLLGLKYYGIVQGKIPSSEITQFNKFLNKVVKNIDNDLEITICGSYRRGKSTSGDIDVLLYHPDVLTKEEVMNPNDYDLDPFLEIFINKLKNKGIILDDITNKKYKMKYMGFMKYKNNPVRRIDIRWIPYESLPTALLYFTGPYELNTMMRKEAKKRNMILNEYGLYKMTNKKLIKIKSEKDVFQKLGMVYLTPQQREYYST